MQPFQKRPVLSNERRTSQSDNSEWPTPKRPVGDAMRTHAGVQLKIHFDRCDEIWRLGVGYRMFSRTVPQGSSSCACALNDRARNNFRDFQSRAKEMYAVPVPARGRAAHYVR